MRDLDTLSWRQLLVLLHGLSPQSATVAAIGSRTEFGRKRGDVIEVKDRAAAQSAFESIYAGARRATA